MCKKIVSLFNIYVMLLIWIIFQFHFQNKRTAIFCGRDTTRAPLVVVGSPSQCISLFGKSDSIWSTPRAYMKTPMPYLSRKRLLIRTWYWKDLRGLQFCTQHEYVSFFEYVMKFVVIIFLFSNAILLNVFTELNK